MICVMEHNLMMEHNQGIKASMLQSLIGNNKSPSLISYRVYLWKLVFKAMEFKNVDL